MTVEDWAVSGLDFVGVIKNDNLSIERVGFLGGVVLGVSNNISSSDVLNTDVFNVESDVVSWNSFL